MEKCIYYFSGTGNSLRAALDLSDLLHAQALPIGMYKDADTVETDAETIGLVFPVYYGDVPAMVREFIGQLKDLPSKTVFAVCTHGGAAMDSLRTVRDLLKARGGKLSLAFGVPMPQNSFFKWYENKSRRYVLWNKRAVRMAKLIERGATGIRYHNIPLEWLMIPFTKYLIKPACRKMFALQSGLNADAPMEQMIRLLDKSFSATDACNGCGTCVKVCPADNIALTDGRPVWQHRCENCLACYNWCPRRAIAGGVAQKGYFYRHPGVGAKDLMTRR